MIVLCASVLLILKRLNPIFSATEVIITYGIKPFDICEKNGDLWKYIKIFYITTFLTSNIICSNLIFNKIPTKKKGNKKCPKRKVEDIEKLNFKYIVNVIDNNIEYSIGDDGCTPLFIDILGNVYSKY